MRLHYDVTYSLLIIINIMNWHETVVKDKATGEGEVYVATKNLYRNNVQKFIKVIKKLI